MAFSNPDFKKIYEFSGKEYIESEFSEYDIKLDSEVFVKKFDIVISVNNSKYQSLRKIENCSKEERKEILQQIEEIAIKFSEFRSNLYTSVINKMISLVKNSQKASPISLYLKEKNILHVLPSNDRIDLVYGINFIQTIDISLTKVFLIELENAKNHVSNCMGVKVYYKENELPKNIADVDKPENYSNGLVVFTLYSKDYDSISKKLDFFVNFSQIVQYHVYTMKMNLHLRMNIKEKEIENKINACKVNN